MPTLGSFEYEILASLMRQPWQLILMWGFLVLVMGVGFMGGRAR